MRFGIEFEYLIVDTDGPAPGRIRDFSNLDFAWISGLLADKPGRDDPALATGDLGIKAGYWYLEGDERFHADGRFRTLEVKGVEIRTPPAADVAAAVARLLAIESELTQVLGRRQLGLGIAGFNPRHADYRFTPPLNDWERALRAAHRAYDGSHISTLSYGPDINLSHPDWSTGQSLDAARKLTWYAPYIVPFSFSSPFYAGTVWGGWSKRTYERAALRPAVKLFVPPGQLAATTSTLAHPARLPAESGRIEFKAFDAMLSRELLSACCHLLEGICLADELPGRSETPDLAVYRRAAYCGLADRDIHAVAADTLAKARRALQRHGDHAGAAVLAPLDALLAARRTPAHALLESYRHDGLMYRPGGFAAPVTLPPEPCHA